MTKKTSKKNTVGRASEQSRQEHDVDDFYGTPSPARPVNDHTSTANTITNANTDTHANANTTTNANANANTKNPATSTAGGQSQSQPQFTNSALYQSPHDPSVYIDGNGKEVGMHQRLEHYRAAAKYHGNSK